MPDDLDVLPGSSSGDVEQGDVTPQADNGPVQDSTPAGDTTPAPSADAEPPPGGEATPDPVQDAIARLAKPEAKATDEPPAEGTERPRDEQGRFAPKKDEPAKPEAAKPEVKPAEKPVVPKTEAEENPLKGFSDAEVRSLNSKTTQRIKELHARAKAAEAKAAEVPAADPLTNDWREIRKAHNIDEDLTFVPPEHLAGVVKIQAAINRAAIAASQHRQPAPADLQAVQHLYAKSAELAKQFGVLPPQPQQAPLEPFKGDLPADKQELVSLYGIPEKHVRLLAAIEARETAPVPPAPAAPAQAASQAPPGVGIDMDALYQSRRDAELMRSGITVDKIAVHLALIEPQMVEEVRRIYPAAAGREGMVFNRLPPKERMEITLAAHRAFSGPAPAPRPTMPAPTRAPVRGQSAGGTPRRPAPQPSGGDPVQDAISRLARPEE